MSIECIRTNIEKQDGSYEILLKLYESKYGSKSTAFVSLNKNQTIELIHALNSELIHMSNIFDQRMLARNMIKINNLNHKINRKAMLKNNIAYLKSVERDGWQDEQLKRCRILLLETLQTQVGEYVHKY